MGRKSLLRSTKKTSVKPKKTGNPQKAERKKAILEGVRRSPDTVKATLKQLGLGQSTYYTWLKQYKAEGVDGLNTGGPVSDKVWKGFGRLQKKQQEQLEAEGEMKSEETQTMKTDKDRERTRKLLFKRFDEEPSKPTAAKERAAEPTKPKASDRPSPPSYTSPSEPPEEPMDKTLKYALGAFVLVIVILLISSVSNSDKFYLQQNDQMIEVWRGRFAPMGEVHVTSFSDATILEGLPKQRSYTKQQAFDAISNYFVKQADKSLNTETPDLKSARSYLAQASKYAVSSPMRQAVQVRLDSINSVRDNIRTYIGGPSAPEEGEEEQPQPGKETGH
jgi:transposase